MKSIEQYFPFIRKRVRFKWRDGRECFGKLLIIHSFNEITVWTDDAELLAGEIVPGTLELVK